LRLVIPGKAIGLRVDHVHCLVVVVRVNTVIEGLEIPKETVSELERSRIGVKQIKV
jgi:hypothetical protein